MTVDRRGATLHFSNRSRRTGVHTERLDVDCHIIEHPLHHHALPLRGKEAFVCPSPSIRSRICKATRKFFDEAKLPLDKCHPIDMEARSIRNYSDRRVVLYEEEHRGNPTVTISPATENGPTENGNLKTTQSFRPESTRPRGGSDRRVPQVGFTIRARRYGQHSGDITSRAAAES
jgi:hypothetical protein